MTAKTIESDDILTPEQLATRLQVNVSWVYQRSRTRGDYGRRDCLDDLEMINVIVPLCFLVKDFPARRASRERYSL
jgi:hypothetical protein